MSEQSRYRLLSGEQQLVSAVGKPSLRQRIAFRFAIWRQRVEMRRRLAEMDARSLRDIGISPAAAAYESGKPFWTKAGPLR